MSKNIRVGRFKSLKEFALWASKLDIPKKIRKKESEDAKTHSEGKKEKSDQEGC